VGVGRSSWGALTAAHSFELGSRSVCGGGNDIMYHEHQAFGVHFKYLDHLSNQASPQHTMGVACYTGCALSYVLLLGRDMRTLPRPPLRTSRSPFFDVVCDHTQSATLRHHNSRPPISAE
jgi:hypothetical protein